MRGRSGVHVCTLDPGYKLQEASTSCGSLQAHRPLGSLALPLCPQAFYGRKVSARQLLLGGSVPPPPAAAALYAALDALMEHAGETGSPRADSFNQLHGQQPAVSGTAVYPAGGYGASGGCGQAELHASGSSSDDEWEPEEEPAVSAPPAPAPHASFFGGLGGGFAAAAPREQLAPYPRVPQVAGARSLYPSLEEEALPYGSLFD